MESAGQVDSWAGHGEAGLPQGRGRPRVLGAADCGPGLPAADLGEAGRGGEAEMVVTQGLGAAPGTRGRRSVHTVNMMEKHQ